MRTHFTQPLIVAGCFVLMGLAVADDSAQIGGSRAAGMGGAGIALPVDVVNNQKLNVAFLSYAKAKHYGLTSPEIGARILGINYSDLHKVFGDVNNGGVSTTTATNLYNDFGTKQIDASVDAGLGIVLSNIAINITGGGDVTSIPNSALETGGPAAAGARLDAYGYAYYQIDAGIGVPVPTSEGSLSVGARVKSVTSYFAHKYVTESGGTVTATNGAEFGTSTEDSMSKSGLGADLGLVYEPKDLHNVYFGATVLNAVVPSVGFTRTLPNSNTAEQSFNPFPTTTTVGVGAKVGKGVLLAADVYDVFGNATGKELRLGGELSLGSLIAVRAGYNSTYGYTIGASILWINLAFSARMPLEATTNIKF